MMTRYQAFPALLAALIASVALALPTLAQRRPPQPGAAQPGATQPRRPAGSILAVVNGDVISQSDVDNRGRLFALSTGLPVNQDIVERLRPQILKQLIDERLRLQEVQRRKIVVTDQEIAEAIAEIEQRNGMPQGLLRAKLQSDGAGYRTLVDQIRVQIGWGRVIRQELGSRAQVSDADIAEQIRLLKQQTGQTEYNLAEIFVPIDDPAKSNEAQRFADTVIGQLRAGAPFPVVAAQFSQSQTALQGGDLGWVRPNQLDPEVAAVAAQMPPGAISNPVQVAGGYSIVQMRGKRVIGQEVATVLNVRQVFLPFETPLNPQAPTDQQKRTAQQVGEISSTVRDCEGMEAAAKAANSPRPPNPGPITLEAIGSPPLRQLMGSLAVGQASKPVVAIDGVAVVMVCSREQKTGADPSKQEVTNRLTQQRVELTSRQLVRDLRRRAVLDLRT